MNTNPLPITLHCQGRSHPIQSLVAHESLNAPVWVQVVVNALPGINPESLAGMDMAVCLPGADGGQRCLYAQVTSASVSEVWKLTLHSRLWQGHLLQKSRLFPELNRPQLVQQLLDEMGYARVHNTAGSAVYRRIYHERLAGRRLKGLKGTLVYTPAPGITLPEIEINV